VEMASRSAIAAFHEKVNRKLNIVDGQPPQLRPTRQLILRDRVGFKQLNKGDAPCVTEMSLMSACWKQNNFVDALCKKEIEMFFKCVTKANAMRANSDDEAVGQGGRLHPRVATNLLKRFPNKITEV